MPNLSSAEGSTKLPGASTDRWAWGVRCTVHVSYSVEHPPPPPHQALPGCTLVRPQSHSASRHFLSPEAITNLWRQGQSKANGDSSTSHAHKFAHIQPRHGAGGRHLCGRPAPLADSAQAPGSVRFVVGVPGTGSGGPASALSVKSPSGRMQVCAHLQPL